MKTIKLLIKVLIALYLILLIPFPEKSTTILKANKTPFVWNQDDFWNALEQSFTEAKRTPEITLDSIIEANSTEINDLLLALESGFKAPEDSLFRLMENKFFSITPFIAARQQKVTWYMNVYNRVRNKIKSDSSSWNLNDVQTRQTTYRLLYGMRAAVEEVLLQSSDDNFTETILVTQEPSSTPGITILGMEVHSGDLLVSRGGAEVSAFISRGNDYPGNFSHVALIHVDKDTNTPYFVEAHIERGVAIASLEDYLNDKKLRLMVMRPRSDMSQLKDNPMLPYEASLYMFNETQRRHIPYDFKMDYYDSSAMFCSEVGSYAYKHVGIKLWEFESTISSPGIMAWLNAFGVEHFVTQMPSDLEYDPMLSVVAEWRDKDTLFKDHLDNAVTDALIARANRGEKLNYNLWQLPIARVLKAYSVLLNLIGKEGVIPESMDAVTALKNNDFVDRFQSCKTQVELKVDRFIKENGYVPPYWHLVKMAEECAGK